MPSFRKPSNLTPLAPTMTGMAMKKEEFRRDIPRRAQQNGAQDGRSRPGGAGDKGQHLKYTDQEDRFVVEFLEIVDPRFLVAAFHPDEEDTVDNQGSRDDRGQGTISHR